jgi:hypothetical protein
VIHLHDSFRRDVRCVGADDKAMTLAPPHPAWADVALLRDRHFTCLGVRTCEHGSGQDRALRIVYCLMLSTLAS